MSLLNRASRPRACQAFWNPSPDTRWENFRYSGCGASLKCLWKTSQFQRFHIQPPSLVRWLQLILHTEVLPKVNCLLIGSRRLRSHPFSKANERSRVVDSILFLFLWFPDTAGPLSHGFPIHGFKNIKKNVDLLPMFTM